MAKVLFEVKLPFTIKKKAKVYISSCPILDVHTQGNTQKEAKENLVEALKLFLITCFERGILDDVLKECGFKAIKYPTKLPKDHRFLTVPIPFTAKVQSFSECHA